MRILVDTHGWLWMLAASRALPASRAVPDRGSRGASFAILTADRQFAPYDVRIRWAI